MLNLKKSLWIFLFLFLAMALQGKEKSSVSLPQLTGSLIAPPGKAVPYGHFMVKSYLFFTVEDGKTYNRKGQLVSNEENCYSLNPQFQCFFGLTPWCDLNITPQFFYQNTENQHSVNFGDLTVGLDVQLMEPDLTPYFPGIKFAVRETFPTGNFEYFHPRKLFTDQTGAGTFATQFGLVFYKLFYLYDFHWLSTTVSAQYMVTTPVNVHDFNSYGGGFGTRGKAFPGNQFQGIASFELTLNPRWALAFDTVYEYTEATQFLGTPGIAFTGTYAEVGTPFSEQVSLAPAIEYHFNSHFGLIAGCWFSVFTRNCSAFQSGVVNFEYTY